MHYDDLQFMSDLFNYLKAKIKDVTIIINDKRKFILFEPVLLGDIDNIIAQYNYDDMKIDVYNSSNKSYIEIYLIRKEVKEDD